MLKFADTHVLEAAPMSEGQLMQEGESLAGERSPVGLDRRRLMTHLGLAAGAAGMLGVAGCSDNGTIPIASPTTTPSVLDVLNFALNLEYFEASFYSYVVTGSGLAASDMGAGAGTASGGAKVTFATTAIQNIAMNLMTEEVQHVQFLRSTIYAIGGTPVSMPSLNLAALGAPTDDKSFIALARTVEGVGVTAYAGGAQYLASSVPALNYAAQILDVEAQHEGCLRQACIYYPGAGGGSVTSPAADALDMPPTSRIIFNTSTTTGLVPVRTISQVLQIVYNTPGATGSTKGGFFPSGFNGNIYIS